MTTRDLFIVHIRKYFIPPERHWGTWIHQVCIQLCVANFAVILPKPRRRTTSCCILLFVELHTYKAISTSVVLLPIPRKKPTTLPLPFLDKFYFLRFSGFLANIETFWVSFGYIQNCNSWVSCFVVFLKRVAPLCWFRTTFSASLVL